MIYKGPTQEIFGFIPSSLQMLNQSEALVAILDVGQGQWKHSRKYNRSSLGSWDQNIKS
jgi:hypothetical protein